MDTKTVTYQTPPRLSETHPEPSSAFEGAAQILQLFVYGFHPSHQIGQLNPSTRLGGDRERSTRLEDALFDLIQP